MGQVHHIALLGICTLLGVAYCMNCPEESGNCQSFVCWYKEWAKTMNQWRLQIESRCTQEELGEEWKELFTCPIMECKNGSTDDCETDPLKCPTENAGIFLDVIFVVDGSSSIRATEFSMIKQWLINRTLHIYNEYGSYAQVEVLQFSNKDQARYNVPIGESKKFIIPINLGDCVNNDSCVTERITKMAQIDGQTYTHYALRRTMEREFLQSTRYNESLKIIVLLTDGEANDATRLPSWYEQYQDVVTTFAVGVGDYHEFMSLLRTVANGNTGNERVFTLDNFEQLTEEIDLMIGMKSLVREEDLKTSKIDMMFVLDGSASVGESNFELMKTWVKNITRYFDMENSTKIGVVQYSYYYNHASIDEQPYIKTEIFLEHHANRADFEDEIDNMALQGFTTSTAHAINKTIGDFNSSDRFDNLQTKKVMILLTDGKATDGEMIQASADYAHLLGIITYAVGVGDDVNKTELSIIANGDSSSNESVYDVKNFAGLTDIVQSLLQEIAVDT